MCFLSFSFDFQRLFCYSLRMKIKEAWELVGGLSEPSKMPCYGHSISAKECKTGAKLRLVTNSVCSKCYALRGNYRYKAVVSAHARRLAALENPLWVEAMALLINKLEYSGHFRWFDSGDLQSVGHLGKIVQVAILTPNVKHWLPTKEYGFVSAYVAEFGPLPSNLVVRLSAYMREGAPPTSLAHRLGVCTSTVVRKGFSCVAPHQENKCLECRACWDKDIQNISYKSH